ncbi:hypothetical protein Catovirus_2_257 [Catovirus CTV1]|uniref:Uncharacterized protein n=1 Tax=Catovirus CTV1 TaxID=1977631 RepID=A0A1V0SCC3_9VIRU|nr:hypothetical protein Catovirus_2_257 [Catovirus CTV1]
MSSTSIFLPKNNSERFSNLSATSPMPNFMNNNSTEAKKVNDNIQSLLSDKNMNVKPNLPKYDNQNRSNNTNSQYSIPYSQFSHNIPYSQNSSYSQTMSDTMQYSDNTAYSEYSNSAYFQKMSGGKRKNYSEKSDNSEYSQSDRSRNMSRSARSVETYDEDDVTGSSMSRSKSYNSATPSDNSNSYKSEDSEEYPRRNKRNQTKGGGDDSDDKPKKELPESIRKRLDAKKTMKDNGITGGIELSSVLETYLKETGLDLKKDLDKAIKIALDKMMSDKRKGTLEKIIQEAKDEIKRKREEKKKNK